MRALISFTTLLLFSLFAQGAGPANHDAFAKTRAAFLKLIDRPRVPLAPEVQALPGTNGFSEFHFSFAADQEQRVPGILIQPKEADRPRPVIIALHGTGGSKAGEHSLLLRLAGKGFLAVAIDGRYHGERTKSGKGSGEYNDAILRAFRTGQEHPFLYDTAWDVLRLVDYLGTRSDVDASRIGLIGFSKGGMETYLAAAADPRIAVAVPCIGVQSFGWALDHNSWASRIETIQAAINGAAQDSKVASIDTEFVRKFYDRVVPGIYREFDGPAMLPLIAPRPLLVINGDSDARTPLPGLQECAEAARRAYASANAEDKFVLRVQEKTGHKVNPDSLDAAVDWFVKWLKP